MSVLTNHDWLKTQFIDENKTADEIAADEKLDVQDVYQALADAKLVSLELLSSFGIEITIPTEELPYVDPASTEFSTSEPEVKSSEIVVEDAVEKFDAPVEEKPAKKAKKAEEPVAEDVPAE